MSVTFRDKHIVAIYIRGDHSQERPATVATALMEASRVILAERLNVQSITLTDSDEVILVCDTDAWELDHE